MTGTRTADFRRARSEEQRQVRREEILRAAAVMLAEMPVSDLSLNELSRRVGLAKSNVLRYFESREAVLLELLDTAWAGWIDGLPARLCTAVDPDASLSDRCSQLAGAIATSLTERPLLCELISATSAVLERNISAAAARRFKLAALDHLSALAALVRVQVPELSESAAAQFAGAGALVTGALWTATHPAPAVLAAYEDPVLAAQRIEFGSGLSDLLTTLLAGLIARSAR